MTGVVLASQSAARQRLLTAAGVTFTAMPASIDETGVIEALKADGQGARAIADCLAELKALRISTRFPEALVIGADQVLSLGAMIFEKPGDRAGARAQLLQLRGQTHMLHSAVCVARGGSVVWRHVGVAKMTMRDFPDASLDAYLDAAGPDIMASVGAYHVEGLGVQLFRSIEGDSSTVQGLPLLPLLDFLRQQGLLIP